MRWLSPFLSVRRPANLDHAGPVDEAVGHHRVAVAIDVRVADDVAAAGDMPGPSGKPAPACWASPAGDSSPAASRAEALILKSDRSRVFSAPPAANPSTVKPVAAISAAPALLGPSITIASIAGKRRSTGGAASSADVTPLRLTASVLSRRRLPRGPSRHGSPG